MKRTLSILFTLVVAVLLVLGIRMTVVSLVTVSQVGVDSTLIQGDRVLVNLWAYGLRSPWHTRYHRYHPTPAKRGDWIVFNIPAVQRDARPDTSSLSVGRVLACPGETVWLGRNGRVSTVCDYSQGCIWPLLVPARGTYIRIFPWNQELYQVTIHRHEPLNADIINDSLCVDGSYVSNYRFHRNYYWISSDSEQNLYDSRVYGFVPEEFVLGQASTVLYSIDSHAAWYKCFRFDRCFQPIGGTR